MPILGQFPAIVLRWVRAPMPILRIASYYVTVRVGCWPGRPGLSEDDYLPNHTATPTTGNQFPILEAIRAGLPNHTATPTTHICGTFPAGSRLLSDAPSPSSSYPSGFATHRFPGVAALLGTDAPIR